MEIKINKDIRGYSELVFFGLTLRQLICSAFSAVCAAAVYIAAHGVFHTEIVSWLCVMSAVPGAVLGFVTYNGMTAEKVLICILRTVLFERRKLTNAEDNIYAEILVKGRGK